MVKRSTDSKMNQIPVATLPMSDHLLLQSELPLGNKARPQMKPVIIPPRCPYQSTLEAVFAVGLAIEPPEKTITFMSENRTHMKTR